MLGNSLATMRIYASLGVRYLTLTHVCHSAFASSAGGGAGTDGSALKPVHAGNGLTDFGRSLVLELNRLGGEFTGSWYGQELMPWSGSHGRPLACHAANHARCT
jgi:hypothetical protein